MKVNTQEAGDSSRSAKTVEIADATEEPKLLPCPHCGGEAAWGEGEQKQKYGNEQVYCTSCYAMTAPDAGKEEAAEWWNARDLTAHSALVAALEDLYDAARGGCDLSAHLPEAKSHCSRCRVLGAAGDALLLARGRKVNVGS